MNWRVNLMSHPLTPCSTYACTDIQTLMHTCMHTTYTHKEERKNNQAPQDSVYLSDRVLAFCIWGLAFHCQHHRKRRKSLLPLTMWTMNNFAFDSFFTSETI
jgi:fatty acid desaturase